MRDDPVLVLGLGNPVMADDGVGLAAMARLERAGDFSAAVEFADGGTWGMRLLPLLQDHDRVLLLDAIDHGAEPGALIRLEQDAIPRGWGTGKLSPHQVDLQDILAAAMLSGRSPGHLVALGLQPGVIEMRVGLSPAVEAGLDAMVAAALDCLREWGVRCRPAEAAAGA